MSTGVESIELRFLNDAKRYLESPFDRLPALYDDDMAFRVLEWRESPALLQWQPEPTPCGTDLFPLRDLRTGYLTGLVERDATAPDKQSMQRMYSRRVTSDVRGSGGPGSAPFKPDGVSAEAPGSAAEAQEEEGDDDWPDERPLIDPGDLLTQPPGLDLLGLDLSVLANETGQAQPPPLDRMVSQEGAVVADALAGLPDSAPSVKTRHHSAAAAGDPLHSATCTSPPQQQHHPPLHSALSASGQKASELRRLASSVTEPHFEWAKEVDSSKPVLNMELFVPNPARTWSFELDKFQQHAIYHLEQRHDVFVAAHTSAGKTVVAEYAIAQVLTRQTRVIYTSPIKALSNQKFHDFRATFSLQFPHSVGLVTGDTQVNQNASCLIMTTEILRSMLYSGSDIVRELEWVIFDEVHYVNDAERGVVWEEVLILLPQHVGIILLSATVPNTKQFANWVGTIKQRPIYVISTLRRPVPLEHFLYTGNNSATSKELFMFIDKDSKFQRVNGYEAAVRAKQQRSGHGGGGGGAKPGPRSGHLDPKSERNVWLSVIEMLKTREGMPAVCFMFSLHRIHKIVENLASLQKLDLNTAAEKSRTHRFFRDAIAKLRPEDRKLPQVEFFGRMLAKGLGAHHSGVLPILKEVVELLFQKGLVKILFATETFAMGVNMPAKTVLFDTVEKHDGKQRRALLPGEYTQMAGRAGRRGIDNTGTVVVVCKGDVPDAGTLENMALGKATKLESKFRVTYAMILNLLRGRALRVEEVLRRSFSEDRSQSLVGGHKRRLDELVSEIKESRRPDCAVCGGNDMDAYVDRLRSYEVKRKQAAAEILAAAKLRPGQLVAMRPWPGEPRLCKVGVLLRLDGEKMCLLTLWPHHQQQQPQLMEPVYSTEFAMPPSQYRPQLVELNAADWLDGVGTHPAPGLRGEDSVRIILEDFKRRELPRFADTPPGQTVSLVARELADLLQARYSTKAASVSPLQDPVNDLGLKKLEQTELFEFLNSLRRKLLSSECLACPSFVAHFNQAIRRQELLWQREFLHHQLSDESLQYLAEYRQRLEVLRRMDFVDRSDQVRLKGQVACQLSTQCILITELVFQNVLKQLEPAHLASLFSCFVCEVRQLEPTGEDSQVSESLRELPDILLRALDRVREIADKAQALQNECQLGLVQDLDPDTVRPALMRVVYEWARGTSFRDITDLTKLQEGLIVRSIQRLDELLKDARKAALVVGDAELSEKFESASQLIKRDIVFAASLYLDDSVDRTGS